MENRQNTYNQQPMPQSRQMMPPPLPPQPPMPMSRRARWGRRLMSGTALMMNHLPNWFATYAVGAYMIALVGVSMLYSSYAMEWYFWLFGIGWVAGFFFLSVRYSREWSIMHIRSSKRFVEEWLCGAYQPCLYRFSIANDN